MLRKSSLRRATGLKRRAQKVVQRLANNLGGHVTIRTWTQDGHKLAEFKATPEKKRRKRLKIQVRKRDLEWARAVKERDGWCCRYTGKQYPKGSRGLHACHIFGRNRRSVRWDLDNGLSLSMGAHLYYHAHPLEFIDFAKRTLGEAMFESLRQRAMPTWREETFLNRRGR